MPCAIAALAALAQESRLDIFRLLVQAGGDGMAVGQIGDRLGLPGATLSFHLNQLRHANLVTFRRDGRSLIYSAAYPVMNDLLAYLTENCCQGDASACGGSQCAADAGADLAPIACTLSGQSYQHRMVWITELNRRALKTERLDGLSLRLSYDTAALSDVEELARRERLCCPFLTFAVKTDIKAVVLTITAPEAARDAAEPLFAQFRSRHATSVPENAATGEARHEAPARSRLRR